MLIPCVSFDPEILTAQFAQLLTDTLSKSELFRKLIVNQRQIQNDIHHITLLTVVRLVIITIDDVLLTIGHQGVDIGKILNIRKVS